MGLVAVSTCGTLYQGAATGGAEAPAMSATAKAQLQAEMQSLTSAAAAAVGPHSLAACQPLRALLGENMRAALQKGPPSAAARTAKDLMTALALCNTVVPQPSDDGASIKYQVCCLQNPIQKCDVWGGARWHPMNCQCVRSSLTCTFKDGSRS